MSSGIHLADPLEALHGGSSSLGLPLPGSEDVDLRKCLVIRELSGHLGYLLAEAER